MQRTKKNYLIYVIMLILFGGLIYGAIEEGSRFDHYMSASGAGVHEAEPFDMFLEVVSGNLHHSLATLLIQIIVVLIAVRIFGYLFQRIGQPGVIGEIVAGIVLGPSLLGKYFPEAFLFLFPPESLTNLELISQIGLVLFMFVIGMELDFSVLKNKINETLVISHAGILVPFFLGIVSSYWIYEEYASSQTHFLPFALFIGISMSITAFPVLARIIQERDMAKSQVGILSIASAANDDVTAWCLLAVVIAIAKAGTFASAIYTIVLTIIYIVIMFAVVRPFLKKLGKEYANQEVINKNFVGFILLVLVVSSVTTEILGIHALFGAFMAGVIMPPNTGFRKVMMEKVEDIALVFFLPLFFAFTGLRTEIGLINSPQLWWLCLFLIAVAVAGKLGGCAIAARLVGESWKDSLKIGTLMNTRGLMELVALNIGYEMGVLPPSIFVILVIMALVTTFMTTPLLHLVDRVFARRTSKESLKQKLLLFFGRADSGSNLLYIYHLLFGRQLGNSHVIAAHYTLGTDLSPLTAEHYEQESFSLLNEEAGLLGLQIDRRYQVTNKLEQEIVQLTRHENPNMLLLGASSRYGVMESASRASSFFHLLRDKVRVVVDQVNCPVGVFVNREYRRGKVTFVLAGSVDEFMLHYLQSIIANGTPVQLYTFDTHDEGFVDAVDSLVAPYAGEVTMRKFMDLSMLLDADKDGLLIMSQQIYAMLAEDETLNQQLPSLLIIRDKK
ncbi:cation:proton antiporter [Bacteroides sp. 51]|uniref:cation:proton antiporter n=1 Tax=Bacteroides sp. 51 TaxID=2302938 RepID=UPI0013D0CE33|nr:cation:proton antiporter [Bacteroides sp. 51]NDV82776.1 cation/H(+) antiporter [Bacteroides sp. 51]